MIEESEQQQLDESPLNTHYSNCPQEYADMIDHGVEDEEVLQLYATSIGLKIQTSKIHGKGLFAARKFGKGFCLCK